MTGLVCIHGSLRRSCETCDLADWLEATEMRIVELERKNATLTHRLQRLADLEQDVARLTLERDEARAQFDRHVEWAASEPHVVGTDTPTPENDPAGRYRDASALVAQIVNEPTRLCASCQHPAKNHTLGRCRKKRCGCGGWRG